MGNFVTSWFNPFVDTTWGGSKSTTSIPYNNNSDEYVTYTTTYTNPSKYECGFVKDYTFRISRTHDLKTDYTDYDSVKQYIDGGSVSIGRSLFFLRYFDDVSDMIDRGEIG